jgi:two-component system cell cycle sensor histidine kinase/response regulator CckA
MQPSATGAPGGPCVIVIDDEDLVRHLTARALSEARYRVLEFPDAESALALLAKPHFKCDLVVTDVRMARMGGAELAARLASSRPGLPVLLISGYTDPRAAPRQGQAQRAFLQKPYSPEQLLSAVRRLLPNNTVPA